MLEPDVYIDLVKESYSKELKGKTLTLNDKIPRIAQRVEAAFKDLGIPFHKTRPARLLLKKMATDPNTIVSLATVEKFETLFAAGHSLPMIGKLLGHTQVQTTARYTHLMTDPMHKAADDIVGNMLSG